MKKYIVLLVLLLVTSSLFAIKNYCVDERYEFVGIVWHLAEADEYNHCLIPSYQKEVDVYFSQYRDHPLISYCKKIRQDYHIGRSAVVRIASYINLKDGQVLIDDALDVNKVDSIDYRWSTEVFKEYVSLLNTFYQDTQFETFFVSQKSIYQAAEEAFEMIMNPKIINNQWFQSFTLENNLPAYYINLSLISGPSNYANLYKKDYDFAILFGCCYSTQKQVAVYQKSSLSVIIHEIMHAYSNPIANKYYSQFEESIDTIFPYVKYDLAKSAYDKIGFLPEWLTSVSTILYLDDNGFSSELIDNLIMADSINGFVWQHDIYPIVRQFNSNRTTYKTYEDFIPELSRFLASIADSITNYVDVSYETPYIISFSPDTNVVYRYSDIDTFVVKIQFSERMEFCVAFGLLADDDIAANKILSDEIQKNGGMNWLFTQLVRWKDDKNMEIRVTPDVLKRSQCNGFRFLRAYKSIMGVPLDKQFLLHYKFKD